MSGFTEGSWWHWGQRSRTSATGASCTGADSGGGGTEGPPSPHPDPPPPGNCPGTVNGTSVNVPCQTTNTPGPTSNSGAPTNSPSPTGATPGGGSTTSTTSCNGGSCTTTTTQRQDHPDGTSTTTETQTTEPREDFCADNPGSLQCTDDDSSFGGSCGAFSCGGDAVQCAIAKEQHKRNCELFETPSPYSEAGIAGANGQARPAGHPGNDASISAFSLPSMLSEIPLFGASGSCPSDVAVGQYMIPFSRMCDSLQLLGVALKALAYLVATFIVFRKGV